MLGSGLEDFPGHMKGTEELWVPWGSHRSSQYLVCHAQMGLLGWVVEIKGSCTTMALNRTVPVEQWTILVGLLELGGGGRRHCFPGVGSRQSSGQHLVASAGQPWDSWALGQGGTHMPLVVTLFPVSSVWKGSLLRWEGLLLRDVSQEFVAQASPKLWGHIQGGRVLGPSKAEGTMWLLIGHVAVSMCGSLQSMDGDPPEEAHGPAAPGCDFCCTLGEGAWMRALHARRQAMQLPDGDPGGKLVLGPLSLGQCQSARHPAPSALKLRTFLEPLAPALSSVSSSAKGVLLTLTNIVSFSTQVGPLALTDIVSSSTQEDPLALTGIALSQVVKPEENLHWASCSWASGHQSVAQPHDVLKLRSFLVPWSPALSCVSFSSQAGPLALTGIVSSSAQVGPMALSGIDGKPGGRVVLGPHRPQASVLQPGAHPPGVLKLRPSLAPWSPAELCELFLPGGPPGIDWHSELFHPAGPLALTGIVLREMHHPINESRVTAFITHTFKIDRWASDDSLLRLLCLLI
ncbi:PREDICTED: uncharacterized protein LOC105592994 isoform X4 [Cercocebus atys]|uniref:uncharacterized protein LOC105592994 isoform X4 n=1 Tax=Cercocebus atys TaxID=9531 RepID=UPI0005F53F72|nr:PREDICTED: uncharacterized protein LOC105592994 isoform X4 [Cercocebus atys]